MEHDNSYKLIFTHAEMMADLLRGFVREEWVAQLDLSTLERVSGSHVSDDLRHREDDLIWRARWGDGWLYVYLLLEFQSTVDPFMAVRLATYVGLLYQDLIRGRQLAPSGRLPPVLPMVLYNGARPWTAATDVAELIEAVPGGLDRYRPRLPYLLIDEGRYGESELASVRNLAAALFRLEHSRSPEDIRRVLQTLIEWLRAPEQRSLRRALTTWLVRVLLPSRIPGVRIQELQDLNEVDSMLAERVKEWTEQWKQQGLEEGRREGLQQGKQEGLQQGLQQGL
ncbi:MAG: Rpn family recombination-promoting nuclease/putative transposase, partial [Pseudomonadota bacterium]|nr:Rpn family recombination-promoting nuclease/putative transposase [Pseudomonadota bacterium]